MSNSRYGPYGGYEDPYDPNDDKIEQILSGLTHVEAVSLAENPAWQQARDPETDEPLYYRDGTPVVYQVPMSQRMAPIVKHRMLLRQWIRSVTFVIILAFVGYVAAVVYAPAPISDFLRNTALPIFANGVVWVAGLTLIMLMIWAVFKIIRNALAGPPKR